MVTDEGITADLFLNLRLFDDPAAQLRPPLENVIGRGLWHGGQVVTAQRALDHALNSNLLDSRTAREPKTGSWRDLDVVIGLYVRIERWIERAAAEKTSAIRSIFRRWRHREDRKDGIFLSAGQQSGRTRIVPGNDVGLILRRRDRIEYIVFDKKLRNPWWQKLGASEDLLRLEIEKQFDRFATKAVVIITPLDDHRIRSNALDGRTGAELTRWYHDRLPL